MVILGQEMSENQKHKIIWILLLHVALLIYSAAGVFSKNAAQHPPFSIWFILFYAGMILVLGIYALFWQQIIKRLPLTFAYANKAVTVIWGVVLGKLVFSEQITFRQGVACGIIIAGTVLYVLADQKEDKT